MENNKELVRGILQMPTEKQINPWRLDSEDLMISEPTMMDVEKVWEGIARIIHKLIRTNRQKLLKSENIKYEPCRPRRRTKHKNRHLPLHTLPFTLNKKTHSPLSLFPFNPSQNADTPYLPHGSSYLHITPQK